MDRVVEIPRAFPIPAFGTRLSLDPVFNGREILLARHLRELANPAGKDSRSPPFETPCPVASSIDGLPVPIMHAVSESKHTRASAGDVNMTDGGSHHPEESSTRPLPPSGSSPKNIGPYRILETLGEGGMGEVFLAEQERPIQRRVALKLIKLGMDTKEVIARFESERQALAIMNHPNVAKVFDAGATEQGRPYFVMEHVLGVPITDYCDRHRLSTRERLELFIPVCLAIHHAHQKGIIHRDIKPSNVLVAIQDGQPVPKVIDFGVAKAVDRRLTERTVFTEQGRIIGTPAYMSPEQAEMTGLNIDTTTDVYSLGVLLYELLVGTLPFDPNELLDVGLDGMHRIIREVDPPTPSSRISTLGDSARDVASHRRTLPEALARQIRGELDWITMRAMEKDRTRRYQSASEFAADITRYLHDEAVLAGPPSLGYRMRKLARRHRGPVVAASAIALTLVLAAVVSTWFGIEAESRRREAEALRQEAVWHSYAANVSAASSSFRFGEVAEAKRCLALCPPELRGWEWFYLQRAVDRSARTFTTGSWVNEVAFSPDGRRLIAGCDDSAIYQWDLVSGRQLATLKGHEDLVWNLTFSPDGRTIASSSRDGTLRLWDAESGDTLKTIQAHRTDVYGIAFGPDGKRLASASEDSTARVWDVSTGEVLTVLRGHTDEVNSVAFSPDGSRIGTGSDDRTVRLWDAASGRLLLTTADHRAYVRSITFSPDGTRIASASDDKTVRVWDTTSGKLLATLEGHQATVFDVEFSPDGERVASASEDKTIRLWDAMSGKLLVTLWGHDGEVWSVAFSANGVMLASGAEDGTVRVWDVTSAAVPTIFAETKEMVWSTTFSPDGTSIAVACTDDTVRVWNVTTRERVANLALHLNPRMDIIFSPDGTRIAGVSQDSTVHISDAATGELLLRLIGHGGPVKDAAYNPDGTRIVSASGDSTARIWNAYTGELLDTLRGHDAGVTAVAFSPDGARIASAAGDPSASADSVARIWDATSGDSLMTLRSGAAMWSFVMFSPDGKWIVTATGKTGRVWNSDTGELKSVLLGHDDVIYCLRLNPDGSRIATASDDRTIRIWEPATGALLATLVGHEGTVTSIDFDPSGHRLVSGSVDKTIRLWDGTPG